MADTSSSEDEFYDAASGDEGWYETDDEETTTVQSPSQDRGAFEKGKARDVHQDYHANGTNASSSFQGAPTGVQVGHGCDTDTEDDDEAIQKLRSVFENMHTVDIPATPLAIGRSATEPAIGSSARTSMNARADTGDIPGTSSIRECQPTLISAERRARRQRTVELIEAAQRASSQPTSPLSFGPAQDTSTHPRVADRATLFRSATMSPVTANLAASSSWPRSKSMNEPDTTSATLLNPDVRDGFEVIAHDRAAQKIMDVLRTPWSVQYEIARGVSAGLWGWDDVTRAKLSSISRNGWSIYSANRVGDVFGRSLGVQKLEIWAELEREQKAIIENATRGLGLMGNWEGEVNWYGGRIQQIARLVKPSGSEKYTLQLGAMQKAGRSHRLGRFLGSRRVLQVKLPKEALYNQAVMAELKEFLSRRFVLCGRVFEAFSVKDEKVYLVETATNYDRDPMNSEGDQHRYSLRALLDWYNPLELNSEQSLSKYAARADLAMSTSVPVLEFDSRYIFRIDDIYAPHSGSDKIPTEKIFTDGCGFMNRAALMKIGRLMGYGAPPTAVQGRILGSKELQTPNPRFGSGLQMKINLVDPAKFDPDSLSRLHRAHLIFDLVMPSRSTFPSRLSRLTIVNLHHNGVPTDIFTQLMDAGLRQQVDALMQWEGASAMTLLWDAVNKVSAVSQQRLRRTAAGIQRALGLTRRPNEADSDDEDDWKGASEDESIDTADNLEECINDVDVPPLSLAESIMERIQAGFSPLENYELYSDLEVLLKNVMRSYIQEYHIVVPESAEAFIVPDPFGILAEGEIHYKSSQDLRDPFQHPNPTSITGNVLIYRNPARVPSDVQKVKAVYKPELADYVDVIVLPTTGMRSLANLLAGGDVDGDVAACIFDQNIVNTFESPPITEEPLNFLSEHFEPLDKIPAVSSLVNEMDACPSQANDRLRQHLLIGLSESNIGKYSMYHENAIYTRGYNDTDTRRLAFMFTTVLDSRKTGLIIKPSVVEADRKYQHTKPVCLGGNDSGPNVCPKRPGHLGRFILEQLLVAGNVLEKELLAKYNAKGGDIDFFRTVKDPNLSRPWLNTRNLPHKEDSPESPHELEIAALRAHVDAVYLQWTGFIASISANRSRFKTQKEKKKYDRIESNKIAKQYAQNPAVCQTLALFDHIERLKASYAYSRSAKFAMSYGFQALCRIKAEATGSTAVTKEFGGAMSISGAEVRVRQQLRTAETTE